ncbi:arsenate reductase family protein [Haloferula sargassicola]|uniref:Uncharacterized protein HI_0103 n=1 Tax=Haloferula sargassicola TaxID=490096 RepID=A0ABP9UP06_9BACT
MKVYAYKNCGTCRKALKWLDERGISYDEIAIREQPPGVAELREMKESLGDLKRLFNTAGGDYRELNMKERLPEMSEEEAFELLSKTGNLVKRPFVIGDGVALTGFKEEEWERFWGGGH